MSGPDWTTDPPEHPADGPLNHSAADRAESGESAPAESSGEPIESPPTRRFGAGREARIGMAALLSFLILVVALILNRPRSDRKPVETASRPKMPAKAPQAPPKSPPPTTAEVLVAANPIAPRDDDVTPPAPAPVSEPRADQFAVQTQSEPEPESPEPLSVEPALPPQADPLAPEPAPELTPDLAPEPTPAPTPEPTRSAPEPPPTDTAEPSPQVAELAKEPPLPLPPPVTEIAPPPPLTPATEPAPPLEPTPSPAPFAAPPVPAATSSAGSFPIPNGGKGAEKSVAPSTPAARSARRGERAAGPTRHVVNSGENFFTISKQYYGAGKYYRALWAANKDRVPQIDKLYIGTAITIPPPEQLDRSLIVVLEPAPARPRTPATIANPKAAARLIAQDPAPTRATRPRSEDDELALPTGPPDADDPIGTEATPRPAPAPKVFLTYKVKPNDSLKSIARDQLGTYKRADEILDLNRDIIGDPTQLAAGQILQLPDDAGEAPRRRR